MQNDGEWLTTSLDAVGVWPAEPGARPEVVIGQRMRAYRERRGMTQADLGVAVRPKMTQSTVAKLEAGARPLRVAELAEVAAALDVAPVALWPDGEHLPQVEAALRDAQYDLVVQERRVAQQHKLVNWAVDQVNEAQARLNDERHEYTRLQGVLDKLRGGASKGGDE